MSFTTSPQYQQEHTAEAMFQALGISQNLTKEQLRRIAEVLSMADDNAFGLEQFLGGTSQTIPIYSSDPPVLTDGMTWINSTTNQYKIRKNGVTSVITTVP